MEIKIILEDHKTNFENQLKEYLEKGYKIKASNIATLEKRSMKPIKNMNYVINNQADNIIQNIVVFYALLIKE